MPSPSTLIGGKRVLLARPFVPRETELVGRELELELVTAAWLADARGAPLSPLLSGPPGVGKNGLVYELARRTGRPLYVFQGHDEVTVEDLCCVVRLSDDPARKLDYVASPLLSAMLDERGAICFVDEIGKVRPRALALLASVLDERRSIDSTLLGERVEASPGFRFIAATNPTDLDGGCLPEFLGSRLRPVVHVVPPPREEIDRIVRSRFPGIRERFGPLVDSFWTAWDAQGSGSLPTPRDAVHAFDLALGLAALERDGAATVRPRHVERAVGHLSSRSRTS